MEIRTKFQPRDGEEGAEAGELNSSQPTPRFKVIQTFNWVFGGR